MENDAIKRIGIVRKVVHVTISADGQRTEHTLNPKELKKWKKDNGYTTDKETESDTE